MARNKGKPNSTIFLISSNITPTEEEITVKAEIANIIGGSICPINHLSSKGIDLQGEINLLRLLFIKNVFKSFKRY